MTLVATAELPGWSSGVSSSSSGDASDDAATSPSTLKTKIKQPGWGWAEACGSQQSGSLTTALVTQTRVSHTTVWQGLRCDRENDSIVHSVHETKMASLCVWVCLFFRPYPELPYLPRPSRCRLSFSSSFSLSGQTSSWPFCRHGGSVLLSQRTAVNTHTTIWQLSPKIRQKGWRSLLSYNVEKRCKFNEGKGFHFTWTNVFAGKYI